MIEAKGFAATMPHSISPRPAPTPTMQRIAVLGSTGSVGRQALDVVKAHPGAFEVEILAAGSNVRELAEQVFAFRPRKVLIADPSCHAALQDAVRGTATEVLSGAAAIASAAADPKVDCVVAAITGVAGLPASLAAVRAGKRLALANKESMVVAGPLLQASAKESGAVILPVDSEHSAIFQCLMSGRHSEIRRLILTASGGPFRTRARETFDAITPAEALRHPTWNMGPKISVDSATMMNKALEIVEARYLFDVNVEQIAVTVHPQSIVHSMVEFIDGTVMAQMSPADMRLPLRYALSWPQRWSADAPGFSPTTFAQLHFEDPDESKFPALRLGRLAAQRGGTAGSVLNAANEVAVALFMSGKIRFPEIAERVGRALEQHRVVDAPDLEQIMTADREAREEVLR